MNGYIYKVSLNATRLGDLMPKNQTIEIPVDKVGLVKRLEVLGITGT